MKVQFLILFTVTLLLSLSFANAGSKSGSDSKKVSTVECEYFTFNFKKYASGMVQWRFKDKDGKNMAKFKRDSRGVIDNDRQFEEGFELPTVVKRFLRSHG